ncbi:109aa long hypothetical protein [Pyrococcus horikoshii OT3]|uniref:Uncharacterized protein n=1 Tax=Pyrococcus horikoshii (strain ATCC 700860 / DSM 12428 / JCM 9974 / NBRC 100139 / OT-3) TaxID=70601 RepID=O58531_PYRHO|nr:109aa long hypothetical protein [Pyrococcus horikoshii OT3]
MCPPLAKIVSILSPMLTSYAVRSPIFLLLGCPKKLAIVLALLGLSTIIRADLTRSFTCSLIFPSITSLTFSLSLSISLRTSLRFTSSNFLISNSTKRQRICLIKPLKTF